MRHDDAFDFKPGSRFGVEGHEGQHPVHDTVVKEYRHLNFFQHECKLRVRTPRVKLPAGADHVGVSTATVGRVCSQAGVAKLPSGNRAAQAPL